MLKLKGTILFCIVTIGFFLDRITKVIVADKFNLYNSVKVCGEYVRITFVFNKGMVFGLNPLTTFPQIPLNAILIFFMTLSTIILTSYYFLNKDNKKEQFIALSLIISGAVGNLYDRIFMEKVIDFIDVGINESLRWPVFNLADAWVSIGAALLLYTAFKYRHEIK